MIPKKALGIVNNTSRDVCNIDHLLFAGKFTILDGDFRQILPVVKNRTKFNIINKRIKFFIHMTSISCYGIKKKMRSCNHDFSEFLLKIGNGVITSFKIPGNWKSSDICTTIYGPTISDHDN